MSTKKQREILRQRRMEFDRRVEENRANMEEYLDERKNPEKKAKSRKSSTTKKKAGKSKNKAE